MVKRVRQGSHGLRNPGKRPLLSNGIDFDLNDDVEEFVERRHSRLVSEKGLDSDGEVSVEEPENLEHDVLPVEVSESENEENSSDEEEDDGEDVDDDDDKGDWGGRRRQWYGGDTYEYEIMEDDERETALQEEEEEAMRMQRKAMSDLRGEDFGDQGGSSDDRDTSSESENEEEVVGGTVDAAGEPSYDKNSVPSSSEMPLLAREAKHCELQMKVWGPRAASNGTAAILFHLYASFVSNVAFYLSLCTDSAAAHVDLRTHPVVSCIVRIRKLLEQALKLPDAKATNWDDIPSLGTKQLNHSTINGTKDIPNGNGVANGVYSDGSSDSEDENSELSLDGAHVNMNSSSNGLANGEHLDAKENTKLQGAEAIGRNADVKKKKGGKKRKKPEDFSVDPSVDEIDDEKVNALLRGGLNNAEEDASQGRKGRKLNRLTNEMERERKNKEGRRMVSADVDNIPGERKIRPFLPGPGAKTRNEEDDITEDVDGIEDDDDITQPLLNKTARRNARKARRAAEAAKPHVYTFNDRINSDEKRRASTNVVKNRGLTRYRPRDKKTPRTKNRLAYKNALKRRKSVAREYTGKPGLSYSGEATGINMSVRRGSKLSTV